MWTQSAVSNNSSLLQVIWMDSCHTRVAIDENGADISRYMVKYGTKKSTKLAEPRVQIQIVSPTQDDETYYHATDVALYLLWCDINSEVNETANVINRKAHDLVEILHEDIKSDLNRRGLLDPAEMTESFEVDEIIPFAYAVVDDALQAVCRGEDKIILKHLH